MGALRCCTYHPSRGVAASGQEVTGARSSTPTPGHDARTYFIGSTVGTKRGGGYFIGGRADPLLISGSRGACNQLLRTPLISVEFPNFHNYRYYYKKSSLCEAYASLHHDFHDRFGIY